MQSRAPQGNVVMRRLKGAREPWRLIPTMSAWVAGGKVGGAILRNSDHGRGVGGGSRVGAGRQDNEFTPAGLGERQGEPGLRASRV